VPRALVVDDDATVHRAAEVRLQRQTFEATGFEATIAGDRMPSDILPSPDFVEIILEPGATLRLRKPFTPNAPPAALNRCLAKPIANARLAQ
jgi:hypothetical protein